MRLCPGGPRSHELALLLIRELVLVGVGATVENREEFAHQRSICCDVWATLVRLTDDRTGAPERAVVVDQAHA